MYGRVLFAKEIIRGACLSLKETWRDKPKKVLSHLKYRLKWNLRPVLRMAGRNPLAVDVELSNGCNFRCEYCHQATGWLEKKDQAFMEWETLEKVVDECLEMGVHSMKVNWRGESTLDPEIASKIRYIKSSGISEVQMNTNGSKLTWQMSRALRDSGLDRIIFSCDSIQPEDYNRLRHGGDFRVFIQNLKQFRYLRKGKKPIIRLNVAVMDQNRDEINEIKEFFKDLVDEFRFNTIYRQQGTQGERRQNKKQGCPQIWQRLMVDVRGNVMPCCHDIKEGLKLGNVHQASLFELWHRMDEIREQHINHKARTLKSCRNCDAWLLSELNEKDKIIWR